MLSASSRSPQGLGDRWIANFGASAFRFRIPAGYGAYGTQSRVTQSTNVAPTTYALPSATDPFVGRLFTERLTIAGREVLLPEGTWTGLIRYSGVQDRDVAAVLGRIEKQHLVGIVATRIAPVSSNSMSASQTGCRDDGAWYFAPVQGSASNGCWWIRSATKFMRSQPAFVAAARKVQESGADIPSAFVTVGFRREDGQGAVSTYYYFEAQEISSQRLSRQTSASLDLTVVSRDPAGQKFLEGLRAWGKNWSQLIFRSKS